MGHFWGPRVSWRATQADQFAGFWEHGWVKIAASFVVHPADGERTVLVVEIRTAATDPRSGVRFRRYWLLAKPGVWLILGRVLAAIRREAEARPPRLVCLRSRKRGKPGGRPGPRPGQLTIGGPPNELRNKSRGGPSSCPRPYLRSTWIA